MLKTNIEPSLKNSELTPVTAMIAELVRCYWILGMECSLLEIQKLAWFLERSIKQFIPNDDPLDLQFVAHKYGPYAHRLTHLLNNLDGSYLHCDKRIGDADPLDVIWFNDTRKSYLQTYLKTLAATYLLALEATTALIDGFESPFGMELLATVDWLIYKEGVEPTVLAVQEGLKKWPAGASAANRKNKLFDERAISIALERLTSSSVTATG